MKYSLHKNEEIKVTYSDFSGIDKFIVCYNSYSQIFILYKINKSKLEKITTSNNPLNFTDYIKENTGYPKGSDENSKQE